MILAKISCRNLFEGNAICMDMTLVLLSDIWVKSHESSRRNHPTVSARFGQQGGPSHQFHWKQPKELRDLPAKYSRSRVCAMLEHLPTMYQ
jgi:hypothetical protein